MRSFTGGSAPRALVLATFLGVLGVLSVRSVPALAQEPEPRSRVRVDGPRALVDVFMTRRARLGIQVNLQARESDSVGAYVNAVTPGGPAEKAGIQTGDVITRLDGTALVGSKRARKTDEERSLPGLRLIELASRLEPNDTVEVEFFRGKTAKKATLVTSDDPARVWTFEGPGGPRGFAYQIGPEMEKMHLEVESLPRRFGPGTILFTGRFADLELAPLNPDLAQYFGTTEGVLVISVPQNSDLKLKGGDVITAVDGRKPGSPGHLLRILQSYDSGESVKFDIMRNRKQETVTGKIPESEGRWRGPRVEPRRERI